MIFSKLLSKLKRARSSATSKSAKKTNKNSGFKRTVLWSTVASFGLFSLLLNPTATKALKDYLPPALEQNLTTLQQQEWLASLGQELSDVDVAALLGSLTSLFDSDPDSELVTFDAQQGHVQTQFNNCKQFFPQRQGPIVPTSAQLRELCFSSFAILHSGQTKTPVFVAQRLNRQLLNNTQNVDRTDKFYEEARLPKAERATLADYRGSGFDRGHMAPAGDMNTAEGMAQSFSLANMVPQDANLNRGPWNKMEQDTRKYVRRAKGDVYVFTGSFYNNPRPSTIGKGRVAVPSHLYKVVYDASTGKSWVHWYENKADSNAKSPISYAEFVRRTGLHVLPN